MSRISAASSARTPSLTAPAVRLERRHAEVGLTGLTFGLLLLSLYGDSGVFSAQVMLAIHVVAFAAGGWYGVVDAIQSMRERRLDINFLMIAAAIGAAAIDHWDEGITLLFLFSLSNTLQNYAMERSRSAISSLVKLRPAEATLIRDGREERIAVERLQPGDRIRIRPGEMVATDGVVVDGQSELDQASVTGESMPVEKSPGDPVFAGTLNGTGSLEVEVVKAVTDSTLARMIQLVEAAQGQKAQSQQFLERAEGYYAVGVIGLALGSAVIPWLMGASFEESFYRAMVLLVVASPCALIIATPAALLSAIANGARKGVLFKGGAHLERLAQVRVVAFDKTGTLTRGELSVTDIVVSPSAPSGVSESELLATAAALESRSEHPIAKAVLAAARERGLELPDLHDFRTLPGRGVYARANGFLVWIGGERMYREHGEAIPDDLARMMKSLEADGKTVLLLHREVAREGGLGQHEGWGGWLGLIAVADSLRPQAAEAVEQLRRLGIRRVAMLTGDNAGAARQIGEAVGVDQFDAGLLPEEKVEVLGRLRREYGPVLMVGDGVNDAPALAAAHVGSAMGAAGSDVALETADLVFMSDDLLKVPYAIALSRRAERIMRQNVVFAIGVIGALSIAAMAYGLALPLGVVGHEGSTLIVVANGLRLLGFRQRM